MFLIDHDESKILIRQEQRRTCANNQLGITLPDHPPAATTFGHGYAGMPFGRFHAKAGLDAVDEFARKRDLWQKNQGLPSHAQAFGNSLKIHFSLPRARHTFQ